MQSLVSLARPGAQPGGRAGPGRGRGQSRLEGRGRSPVSSRIGPRAAGGARRLPIGPQSAGRGRASPELLPRIPEPVKPAEPSYQRGQLVACPCASAPAQFNGHCPPASLFRRRPLPEGLGWGWRAGNALSRGPDTEAVRARGQRGRPPARSHPRLAVGASEPDQGTQLGSAQPFPLGLSLPVCRVGG